MAKIGFDIGGTNIAAGLVSDDGVLLKKGSLPFPQDKDFEKVLATCEQLVTALEEGESEPVEKIGVAVPGSIDATATVVLNAYNLGFHNTALKAALEERLHKKVYLINDADAAVLAEHRVGSLKGCTTAFMITLGTGLGGGLILNNTLFRGGRNNGSEPGHMILVNGGRPCTCGNEGCAEAYCAATRLVRDGKVYGWNTAKAVIDAAKAGDEYATTIINAYVDDIGSYIASIINLLDPERIAIGGGVSAAGDFLMNPIRENVARKTFFAEPTEIVVATAGNDAGIYGAAFVTE